MRALSPLSATLDPRANGLNLIRLLLAMGVIIWHSFPLTGVEISFAPARQLLAEIWVDGFFAISGFLIVGSWMRNPRAMEYLRARLLRIMPAFWTCLAFTALILCPVFARTFGPDNFGYILRNAGLWIFQRGIDGSPAGVPYPGSWNGSLWTLSWEFGCYIAVLLLGVIGLLKYRLTSLAIFATALATSVGATAGMIDAPLVEPASRFGVMFAAGAVVYQLQSSLRVHPLLIALAGVTVVCSLWLPDYRIVAAIPLAYFLIVSGALIKSPRLRFRNDVSYGVYIYAFPVQQVLALCGLAGIGVGAFAVLSILCTLPLAIASWFLIEKPTLRFKSRASAGRERQTSRS